MTDNRIQLIAKLHKMQGGLCFIGEEPLDLWVNHSLSATVFGGKQNYDFWKTIFDTGKTQAGQQALAKPLNLDELIT